ncbi:MAG: hypothetical protein NZT61_05975 [Deltaproteobacteria bacterium]|nr:hypothetical protein [Deltaproteobacteria bacterium]MCX7952890.1 hypothetical protein [Deltaproteobacteria bacterium]
MEFYVDDISFLRDILDTLEEKKASYSVINENLVGRKFVVQVLKCKSEEEIRKAITRLNHPAIC